MSNKMIFYLICDETAGYYYVSLNVAQRILRLSVAIHLKVKAYIYKNIMFFCYSFWEREGETENMDSLCLTSGS